MAARSGRFKASCGLHEVSSRSRTPGTGQSAAGLPRELASATTRVVVAAEWAKAEVARGRKRKKKKKERKKEREPHGVS